MSKAMLVITVTKPSGEPDFEIKLWHSWDAVTIDPASGVVSVNGQTFNREYPLDNLIKIMVVNTQDSQAGTSI